MPIKIKIVELGPIRDSEIEFHPFLLFTGESNTGKSYTALLIYSIVKLLETKTYFKQFEQMIFNYEIRDNSINYRIKPEYFSNFYNDNIPNYFSYLIGNKHANCKIQVFIDSQEDYFLEINESSVYIKDSTLNTLDKLSFDNIFSDKRFDYIIEQSENSVFNKFINEFKLIINKSFILPPGRGVLVDSSYSIKKGTSNAGMYENFLEDLDLILSPSFNNEKKNNKFLDELLSEIFKGYFRKDGDRIYYKTKSFDIPLTSSASSIKELSPLYFILKKFPIDKTFLFIEEPESHIHPELQRKVARLLAYMINQNG
ncbi:MAG: hypothetical protein QG635_788, partial [Bacteroidota bacterium]|nr:hypothetical protein [Bacteroidota bacterium]